MRRQAQGSSPPASFDQLRKVIHERYDTLSPQLQRIAQSALDDPDGFALETVVVLAEAIGVQPSSLVRFAQVFGYTGFSDMQRVFRLRLIEGAPVYRGRIHEHRDKLADAAEGDPLTILQEFANASALTLNELSESVAQEDLLQAMQMLQNARDVFVIGQRRAFPLAAYFAYGLTRLEMRCHLLDFVGGMVPQQVASLTPDDLLVAVSFAEYAPPVVEVVQDVFIRGIPTLTITDTVVSPLAKHATLSFVVKDADVHRFRPIAAQVTLIQSIIIALSYARDKAVEQSKVRPKKAGRGRS